MYTLKLNVVFQCLLGLPSAFKVLPSAAQCCLVPYSVHIENVHMILFLFASGRIRPPTGVFRSKGCLFLFKGMYIFVCFLLFGVLGSEAGHLLEQHTGSCMVVVW
jgi:hypothetical protein